MYLSSWVSLKYYILNLWQMAMYTGLYFDDNSFERENIYSFKEFHKSLPFVMSIYNKS